MERSRRKGSFANDPYANDLYANDPYRRARLGYILDPMTWVHDSIYAAGGDYVSEQWRQFHDATGIEAVLHLSPRRPMTFQGPPPRRFLWLDYEDEHQAGLEERWLAASFIYEAVKDNQLVLIHHPEGMHRTRWAFVAYYLMAGKTLVAALHQAQQRPWLAPYHTELAQWETFLGSLIEAGEGPPGGEHAVP